MKTKIILALLILELTACAPALTPAPTGTSVLMAVVTTSTQVVQPPTILPTATLVSSPISLKIFPLENLRMAFVVDGNLYIKDGNNPPRQLTYSGEDSAPTFSDDGKKLEFFRGKLPHNVFTINADGSQEQALITNNLLTALNRGYGDNTETRSLAFVPGTHQLLFNTHELASLTPNAEDVNLRLGAKPNQDLLLVDTYTSEIKRILEPGQGGIFQVSPNGKLVGVQSMTILM